MKKRIGSWQQLKNYYPTAKCIRCGEERRIVARGMCDSCRIINKRQEASTQRFIKALARAGFKEEAEEWANKSY